LEASAGIAAEVVGGCIESTAAELDVAVSGVVGFAVVGVMVEVVCISESEYARMRVPGRLEFACIPAVSDAVEVELWSISELVAAVVIVELARVVEVARAGRHYDSEVE